MIRINKRSIWKREIKIEREDYDFEDLMLLGDSEYMPLASLFIEEYSGRYDYTLQLLELKNELYLKFPAIESFMFPNENTYGSNISKFKTLGKIGEMLQEYLDAPVQMYLRPYVRHYSKTSYDLIQEFFLGTLKSNFYLQSMKKLTSGQGMIFHDEKNEIIMTFVFKTDLAKYYKLKLITENKIDFEGMEFWITEGFDSPQYEYQGLRKMYRKYIKPSIIEAGIPIIEKPSINDLLVAELDVPENSIQEMEEWKTEILNGLLEKERENMEFHFA